MSCGHGLGLRKVYGVVLCIRLVFFAFCGGVFCGGVCVGVWGGFGGGVEVVGCGAVSCGHGFGLRKVYGVVLCILLVFLAVCGGGFCVGVCVDGWGRPGGGVKLGGCGSPGGSVKVFVGGKMPG